MTAGIVAWTPMPERRSERDMKGRGVRYPYPGGARELTVHAATIALILWSAAAADIVLPGRSARLSQVKGNDFVVFYLASTLARTHDFATLVDDSAFRRAQLPLRTPGLVTYPAPFYGLQLALALAPLSWLPYETAYATWSVVTALIIGWAARRYWRGCPQLHRWPGAFAAATLAFGPFPFLVLVGQVSALSVAAFAAMYLALERRSRVGAGIAVGLLAYKAPLFVPVLAACIIAGEWTIIIVALGVASAQTLVVSAYVGGDVFRAWLGNIAGAARNPDAVGVQPYLMASWRSFWILLLPPAWARAAYGLCAVSTVAAVGWAWRRTVAPVDCVAILSLGTVLAAPHLYLYDLVILLPAFVASVEHLVVRRLRSLWLLTLLSFLSPFTVAVAAPAHLQLITPILGAWFVALIAATVVRRGTVWQPR